MDWKQIFLTLIPNYQGHKKELVGAGALLGALLLGFIIIASGIGLVETLSGLPLNDLEKVGEVILENLTASSMGFIGLLVILVFVEEFFFRSFLVPKIGIILSTIFFTILHTGYGSIAELIGVFFLGLILAYWFKRNKSIFQNYIGHLLYNLLAILLYLLM